MVHIPSPPSAYVGDVEHDLEVIRLWTESARRTARSWIQGRTRVRAAQQAVDDAIAEIRRTCVELEKLGELAVEIPVWEAILVATHLREALGGEDKHAVHAAAELLAQRERAIVRVIAEVKPARIHDSIHAALRAA